MLVTLQMVVVLNATKVGSFELTGVSSYWECPKTQLHVRLQAKEVCTMTQIWGKPISSTPPHVPAKQVQNQRQ